MNALAFGGGSVNCGTLPSIIFHETLHGLGIGHPYQEVPNPPRRRPKTPEYDVVYDLEWKCFGRYGKIPGESAWQ